ncbi:MAG TPA: hypothetical protein VGX76_05290 [Pirellulales bacterium]|jgi:hypothetical protein|nr:hypothetical protein [Pirellulales bacterium]
MNTSMTITVPALGEFLLGNAGTAHNRCAKAALRTVMATHHRERIPEHFTQGAHAKYGYAMRKAHYRMKKQKQWGSSADLVQTGASARQIKATGKVSVGGNPSAGTANAKLVVSFSWADRVRVANAKRFARGKGSVNKAKVQPGVTIPMMKAELQRITRGELGEINHELGKEYTQQVKDTTGSRQQIKA